MVSKLFCDDILQLKNRLDLIENNMQGQIKDIQIRDEKWKALDEKIKLFKEADAEIIKLNVGGKRFATRKEILLKVKDSFFDKVITSQCLNLNNEIFFDRPPKMFGVILEYLRYGTINYTSFSKEELAELQAEALYYEIPEIIRHFEEQAQEIDFVSFETSGLYSNSFLAKTNKLSDLKTRDLTTGICVNAPAWIVIEFNNECEFSEIEIGGLNESHYFWSINNGSNSTVQTSKNKTSWNTVGVLPATFGEIQTVQLAKSTARYIKIMSNSYIGIGFLKIIKQQG